MDNYQPALWEKICTVVSGLAGFGVTLYLLVRNVPFSDSSLAVAMRIILAVCAAILGATIPGFLSVSLDVKGGAIRAAGALALFVVIFFFAPTVIPAAGYQSGYPRQHHGFLSNIERFLIENPPGDGFEMTIDPQYRAHIAALYTKLYRAESWADLLRTICRSLEACLVCKPTADEITTKVTLGIKEPANLELLQKCADEAP